MKEERVSIKTLLAREICKGPHPVTHKGISVITRNLWWKVFVIFCLREGVWCDNIFNICVQKYSICLITVENAKAVGMFSVHSKLFVW